MEITIILPLRTVSKLNTREHWAKKAKRNASERQTAKLLVGAEVKREGLKPPAKVTLTRIGPNPLDGDNLQGSNKSVRDGIADAFGLDDRSPLLTWVYSQRTGRRKAKGRPAEYAVEVTIERAD